MTLTATLHRFEISVSDVDRNVYEAVDLRVARHPSETMSYMLARVLAYCLAWEPGIELGPGLCVAEEPAVRVRDAHGNVTKWIDVGTPSAERLHRACKATPRVAVFTHHNPDLLRREATRSRIHRLEHVQAFALEPHFLDALGERVERHTRIELTLSESALYMKVRDETFESTVDQFKLGV